MVWETAIRFYAHGEIIVINARALMGDTNPLEASLGNLPVAPS